MPPPNITGIIVKPHAPVRVHEVKQETREKQAIALALRQKGYSFQQMADQMGISKLYARKLFLQAMAAIITPGVEEMRKLENARLDQLQEAAFNILNMHHPLVNSGSVVRTPVETPGGGFLYDEEGNLVTAALTDSGPRLAAIKVILSIMDQRAKLNGLNAPTKIAQTNVAGDKESEVVQFYLPGNGRDESVVSEQ